jgi:hypothetical protein
VTAFLRLAGFTGALAAVLGAGHAAGSALDSGPAAPAVDTRDRAHGGQGSAGQMPQPDVAGPSVSERVWSTRLALRPGSWRIAGTVRTAAFTVEVGG